MPTLANKITNIRERFNNRPDSEHEQVIVRIVLYAMVLVYLIVLVRSDPVAAEQEWPLLSVFSALLLFAMGLLILIYLNPGVSRARRISGNVIDILGTTFWLAATNVYGTPWYSVYLWVTLGNGFRYGNQYLLISAILSICGFSYVIATTPFWHDNSGLSIGLLAALFVLPGYAALLIQRLEREKIRALAASKAKSEFLAMMSHEMRTPMNAIIGYSSLLQKTSLTRRQANYLQNVYSSANGLLRVINDVLDLSAIEAKEIHLSNEPFDLRSSVENTFGRLAESAFGKKLNYVFLYDYRLPIWFVGDEQKLNQVLTNLLSNAIKYTRHGEVTLHLEQCRQTDNGTVIRFEVEDTGIGVEGDAIVRIFQPFEQLEDFETRRYEGTGLGLAISRQLVTRMGGEIHVESQREKGSRFWFELELSPHPGKATAELRFSDISVAVIEQHTAARQSIEDHFFALGFTVNPLITLTPTSQEQNQLIALGLSDEEVQQLIDEPNSHYASHRPTIALVNSLDNDLLQQLQNHGFTRALPKTISRDMLAAELDDILAPPGTSLPEPGSAVKAPEFNGQRVLIIDDDNVGRRFLRILVEEYGLTVDEAVNGEDAIRQIKQQRYELIFTDIQMPLMSGVEVASWLRNSSSDNQQTPLVAITAHAMERELQSYLAAGMDECLTKPVYDHQLLACLQHWLTAPQAQGHPDVKGGVAIPDTIHCDEKI